VNEDGGGASRSTDPAAGSSAATDVSLREYLAQAIVQLDRHLSNEIKRIEQALAAEVELRRARRQDDLMAIEKAEESMNKRLDSMNELRAQLNQQATTFVSVGEFRAEMDKVEELITRNREDLESMRANHLRREVFDTTLQQWTEWRAGVDNALASARGQQEGSRLTLGNIVTLVTIGIAVIGVIVVLANYFSS
jgi:succinate dehydrogenase/fumarate reductase flavoprotein subunit